MALSSLVKTGLIMALELQGEESRHWRTHAAVTGLRGHATYAVAVDKVVPGCAHELAQAKAWA